MSLHTFVSSTAHHEHLLLFPQTNSVTLDHSLVHQPTYSHILLLSRQPRLPYHCPVFPQNSDPVLFLHSSHLPKHGFWPAPKNPPQINYAISKTLGKSRSCPRATSHNPRLNIPLTHFYSPCHHAKLFCSLVSDTIRPYNLDSSGRGGIW